MQNATDLRNPLTDLYEICSKCVFCFYVSAKLVAVLKFSFLAKICPQNIDILAIFLQNARVLSNPLTDLHKIHTNWVFCFYMAKKLSDLISELSF